MPERTLVHEPRARACLIEVWRREYNEERPKKSLGGLTPAQYAKQLANKAVTIPETLMPCATESGGTSTDQQGAQALVGDLRILFFAKASI
jgi:hypothetical protein